MRATINIHADERPVLRAVNYGVPTLEVELTCEHFPDRLTIFLPRGKVDMVALEAAVRAFNDVLRVPDDFVEEAGHDIGV